MSANEITELRDNDYFLLDKEGRRTLSGRALKEMIGGGGSTSIVVLTQEEYDDLDPKDPNTLYVVSE